MKKIIYVIWLAAMITPFAANAGSILRIQCEDEDAGTEVYINGKQIGTCPLDAPVEAGTIKLSARAVKGDYERVFEKQLRVFDNVAQRVEIVLSAPQLTAGAKNRIEAADAGNQLRAAEAGDVEAMKRMAQLYDAGMGIEKNPAKARFWRDKAEATAAQTQLRAANAGNISAMEAISARYAAGRGVNKDASQAQLWRNKAEAAKRQNIAQQKAQEKAAKIDQISYFEFTKEQFEVHPADIASARLSSATTWSPLSLLTDLIVAPTKTSEINAIKNEAALRPSTWGKPDSMIARASRQHHENTILTDEAPLIVAVQ